MAKTKEEGVVYVSSAGTYWEQSQVDATQLKEVLQNNYLEEQIGKLVNKVCTGMYTIVVKDEAGNPHEETTRRIMQMVEAPGVRLWAKIKMSCRDIISYGCFPFNDVWDMEGTETYLAKLKRFPPETFEYPAPGRRIYNPILEGITLNDKRELELWQTGDDGKPMLLKSSHLMKDQSTEHLGGTSMVISLVPIVTMIKFCWNAQMQKVNRVGSPTMFIKVTNPKNDDEAYAQRILNRWGKDSAYQLRPNMEVIELKITDSEVANVTISQLEARIKAFFSGASSIQKEGNTLGGNASAEKEMDDQMVGSLRTVLEDEWESFLSQYLSENKYLGWSLELKIAAKNQIVGYTEARQADVGYTTKSMTINERREKLGLPTLGDDDLEKLMVENERLSPGAAPPSGTSSTVMPFTATDPIKAVETRTEDKLKAAYDKLQEEIMKALENEEV